MADDIVDTSGLNIYQLKDLIAERVLRRERPRTQVVLTSFGYKHGLPLEADIVFDTRLLPNPFYVERLRTRNGKAPSVRRFVLASPGTQALPEPGSAASSTSPCPGSPGRARRPWPSPWAARAAGTARSSWPRSSGPISRRGRTTSGSITGTFINRRLCRTMAH
ncbi:MAG: hypothetical protein MZV64_49705 [Ignavibacteriales bacterium]|nr:hypothetical protein [Ignavibacteriales bacterium]